VIQLLVVLCGVIQASVALYAVTPLSMVASVVIQAAASRAVWVQIPVSAVA
jgi:hypothetical protein